MDKPDWAPALCKKCFRHNPGHMELDCPQYEQCQRCYRHGTRGFTRHHACGVQAEEDEDMDFDVDEEVYQGCEQTKPGRLCAWKGDYVTNGPPFLLLLLYYRYLSIT